MRVKPVPLHWQDVPVPCKRTILSACLPEELIQSPSFEVASRMPAHWHKPPSPTSYQIYKINLLIPTRLYFKTLNTITYILFLSKLSTILIFLPSPRIYIIYKLFCRLPTIYIEQRYRPTVLYDYGWLNNIYNSIREKNLVCTRIGSLLKIYFGMYC